MEILPPTEHPQEIGYLTARETLECMPVMTINKQPTNYDLEELDENSKTSTGERLARDGGTVRVESAR